MIEFTKEEVSLCKQVAKRHWKKIKYGDWYEIKDNLCLMASKFEPIMHDKIIPLWTISDCLEFLREKCQDHVLLIHDEGMEEEEEWFLWFDEYKKTQQWASGKTALEACLKVVVVLVVLEERK